MGVSGFIEVVGLLHHGFGPLANPVLRRTMARVVTIEQACRREGVDLHGLLTELRGLADTRDTPFTIDGLKTEREKTTAGLF